MRDTNHGEAVASEARKKCFPWYINIDDFKATLGPQLPSLSVCRRRAVTVTSSCWSCSSTLPPTFRGVDDPYIHFTDCCNTMESSLLGSNGVASEEILEERVDWYSALSALSSAGTGVEQGTWQRHTCCAKSATSTS